MYFKTNLIGIVIIAISFILYISILFGHSIGILSYPSIIFSSILLIGAQLIVIKRVGIVSIPSVFLSFIIYPVMIPFLADYVLHVPNYTLRGVAYSQPSIIRRGVFLTTIFVWIFAGIVVAMPRIPSRTQPIPVTFISQYSFPQTKIAFIIVSAIVLFSAYLTTPGPTILTVEYSVVRDNYLPWATFAGSLYMGSWIVLMFISRQSNIPAIKYIFYLITALTVLWLLLHARRNESLGVVLTVLIVYGNQFRIRDLGSSLRATVSTCIIIIGLGLQVVVGQVRSGANSLQLMSVFTGSSHHGEVVRLPGGGHNIFATYQFTLHHFSTENFLLGETFIKYPIQSVPTPILRALSISQPPTYFNLMGGNFSQYHGGNYLLNEFFANFGPLGIMIAAVMFGLIAIKAQWILTQSNKPTLWAGFSAGFIIGMPRSMWYWQGNWINVMLAISATYVLYLLIVNLTTKDDMSTLVSQFKKTN